MLNEFNEGGTHEQNPLGGIPMGQGANGNQNVVEQGETMKDKFVYSNRITLTPEIIAKFNLPKSLAGKTVADATKLINKKFEGRNDKMDLSTKKNFLDRIGEAQETIKAEEQAQIQTSMQANSQEVPDMMGGQVPQGMEQFMQQGDGQNTLALGGDGGDPTNEAGLTTITKDQLMNSDAELAGGNTFNNSGGNGNGAAMGMIGNAIGGIGDSLAPGGTFGKSQVAARSVGYHDSKLDKDQAMEKTADGVKDSVASVLGPFGQLFRGIQKAGKGLGNSIGGESGAAVAGAFSPEEGTMSNLTNKDLSFGEKVLGTVPGLGGVMAKRSADERLNKFKQDKQRSENFYKYYNTEDFDNVKTFANGGMLGDPIGDPKKKVNPRVTQTSTRTSNIINNNDPRLQKFNSETGIEFTPEGMNSITSSRDLNDSKFKRIYKIQDNVIGPGGQSGKYYWYNDPNNTKNFNIEKDRDFVTDQNHLLGLKSLNSNERNPMITSYLDRTGGKLNRPVDMKSYGPEIEYKYGGQMRQNSYNNGGLLGGIFNSSPERQEMRANKKFYRNQFNEGLITRDQFRNIKSQIKEDFRNGTSNGLHSDKSINRWNNGLLNNNNYTNGMLNDNTQFNNNLNNFSNLNSTYKYGGNMKKNSYYEGGPFDENSITNPQDHVKSTPQAFDTFPYGKSYLYNQPLIFEQSQGQLDPQFQANLDYAKQAAANNIEGVRKFGPQSTGHSPYQTTRNIRENVGEGVKKAGDWLDRNGGKALRYSPVAMNAFQLGNLGKPEVERLDRLNNQYQKQYLDEKTLENIARQQAAKTSDALGKSGISGGQLVNAQLAAQLNATKGISDAYSQIKQHNMNEDKLAQQTKFGNNQANIGQSNLEKDINARNRGAYTTEKSKLLGQIGNDLGNIGKEEVYKNLASEAFGYTYDGEYVRDDKGNVVKDPDTGKPITKEQLDKAKKYAQTFNTLGKREFGSLSLNNKNTKE